MKLSTATLALLATGSNAFSPNFSNTKPTSLNMVSPEMDRRETFSTLAKTATSFGLSSIIAFPSPVFAKDFTPTFDDIKQLYGLGMSLDKLNKKVSDPDQFEAALVGLRSFNKDSSFYTVYTRNFVSKSVKNNADGDSRVGYIRQASSLIGSIQELLEGRQGLLGEDAAKEASSRVTKAQNLVAKCLAESGVDDEKVKAFVDAHP